MDELINIIKSIGALLATISALTYGFGYLTLRARSYFLGTDSAFELLDESYIFAGFRFLFTTSVIIILLVFVFALSYWIFCFLCKMPTALMTWIEWFIFVTMAVLTFSFFKILKFNGILLKQGSSKFSEAILGKRPQFRLALTFLLVFAATVSFSFLIETYQKHGFNMLVSFLSILFFIQLCVLPIFHGAFFADHKVRILASPPAAVSNLQSPVAILERNKNYATLIGKDRNGVNQLITVKVEDLNGVPVLEITDLNNFMNRLDIKK